MVCIYYYYTHCRDLVRCQHVKFQYQMRKMHLLRYCGVPKIMHLLRTVPPCLVNIASVQHYEHIVLRLKKLSASNEQVGKGSRSDCQ